MTKTVCHFEEGDFLVVDQQKSHTLRPVIDGQDYIISRTTWTCEYIDSDQSCPYQEGLPTTQIQTTKFIPSGYLTENSKIKYTMTLETANVDSETGFDKLTDCSISL